MFNKKECLSCDVLWLFECFALNGGMFWVPACPRSDFTYCECGYNSIFEDTDISMCPKSRILTIKGAAFHSEISIGIHFLRGLAEGLRAGRVFIITDLPKGLCTLQLGYDMNGLEHGISFYLLSEVKNRPIASWVRTIQFHVRVFVLKCREAKKKKMEAVAMGLHPRLGSASIISCLTNDLLALCVGFC